MSGYKQIKLQPGVYSTKSPSEHILQVEMDSGDIYMGNRCIYKNNADTNKDNNLSVLDTNNIASSIQLNYDVLLKRVLNDTGLESLVGSIESLKSEIGTIKSKQDSIVNDIANINTEVTTEPIVQEVIQETIQENTQEVCNCDYESIKSRLDVISVAVNDIIDTISNIKSVHKTDIDRINTTLVSVDTNIQQLTSTINAL